MTIIVFLVDTSASMNQRTYMGTTILDTAKAAVENFMKIRARDPASRMDRYMLLTFEDPPSNIKAGWKESHATFMNELKNLTAVGLTALGPALKHTFDLLNVNRMQSGIDTYGQGRFPFYLEPAVIICITDGRKLTTTGTVQNELNLPMNNQVPGSELTKEPFRWDQRLFGLALRIAAVPPLDPMVPFIPPAEDSPLDAMCEVTGGRSYVISSQRTLMQCLDSLVQKVQAGVVINFEKMGADPPPVGESNKEDSSLKENQDANKLHIMNSLGEDKRRSATPTPTNTAWINCHKMIMVPRSAQKGYSVGFWPIPESFWPDLNSPTLPSRSAHPVVKFSCSNHDPMVVDNVPFDKYELEPSPLTQYILERRQPNVVWQVFVGNSAKYSDIGHPFGYLKPSSNLSTVNLFVMPYNYPVLLPLLDELYKVHKCKPTQKWRQQFENYLKTMPVYYAQPLRRALTRLGVANLVPDQMDNCLSYSVVSYLKKLKNTAKSDHERLVASVGQRHALSEGIKVTPKGQTSLLQRKDFNQLLQHYGGDISHLKQELNEFNTFTIAVPDKELKPQTYRNPFDIPRKNLLDQVSRMRANFLQTSSAETRLQDEDELHTVAVQQMGNYQEYLKRMPSPLRELDTQPVRQHMFGNPFKVNKNLMIDEADEAMPGQQSSRKRSHSSSSSSSYESLPPSPSRKRKPGPLPKDVPYRRINTPTPPASPMPDHLDMEGAKFTSISLEPSDNDSLDKFVIDLDDDIEKNHNDISPGPASLLNNHVEENSNPNHHNEPVKLDNGTDEAIVIPQNNKISARKVTVMREHNTRLRTMAVKEVRRPGKNYDALFEHLKAFQGDMDSKFLFVRDIGREAIRFKRNTLVHLLEQYEQTLLKQLEAKKNKKSPSR